MANTARLPTIPRALGGPISDDILEQLIEIGRRAQQSDELSTSDASMVLITLPSVAEELLKRRRLMDTINDLSEANNIYFLSPGTAAT